MDFQHFTVCQKQCWSIGLTLRTRSPGHTEPSLAAGLPGETDDTNTPLSNPTPQSAERESHCTDEGGLSAWPTERQRPLIWPLSPASVRWTEVTILPPRDFLLRTTMLMTPPPLNTAFMTCFRSLLARSTSFIFNNQSFTLRYEQTPVRETHQCRTGDGEHRVHPP